MTIDSILTQLESLHAASTQGEWHLTVEDTFPTIWLDTEKEKDLSIFDLNFIAAAHNHLPAVIAEVRRLQSQLNFDVEANEIQHKQITQLREENIALKAEVERLRSALEFIVTGPERDDHTDEAHRSNRYRLRAAVNRAKAALGESK